MARSLVLGFKRFPELHIRMRIPESLERLLELFFYESLLLPSSAPLVTGRNGQFGNLITGKAVQESLDIGGVLSCSGPGRWHSTP